MAAGKEKRPLVIVRKKKIVGGGHHGGSWKVAYADFVTAMMAFFLVMWIVGMDDQTKQAIEGYFSNPVGYKHGYSAGANPLSSGNSPAAVKRPSVRLVIRAYEQQRFEEVSKRLEKKLREAQAAIGLNATVEVLVTEQGLRIELIEGSSGDSFFPLGSAQMKASGRAALRVIASELRGLANPLILEGHTDAAQYSTRVGYTNWELSADRANAARRVLEADGIDPARISAVRGLADRHLRDPDHPRAPNNRRISILLPYSEPAPAQPPPLPPADGTAPIRG
ncbi:MAG TPA: flagellar motor protein MotB [Gemmatimonadaceae bacterium]|nr:flagellar motor protein MotB [Gemmatimonadaceae bacterium]